jgi:hypothetical protein
VSDSLGLDQMSSGSSSQSSYNGLRIVLRGNRDERFVDTLYDCDLVTYVLLRLAVRLLLLLPLAHGNSCGCTSQEIVSYELREIVDTSVCDQN